MRVWKGTKTQKENKILAMMIKDRSIQGREQSTHLLLEMILSTWEGRENSSCPTSMSREQHPNMKKKKSIMVAIRMWLGVISKWR
jgi:hypothetical protein